ncbi:hypothetical protein [Boudabousia marimammalium]|uniref:Uncharacterized protein n=1 Tax=Boudabousia marimammalium TaxID=156892 RepID=A0A1Q5PMA7_9ACTO|nr:hypothetical protein [Boudabousia marimammalium]OKL48667.1 hypothetical protein BM477_05565 [Boudabousia marimammalium]
MDSKTNSRVPFISQLAFVGVLAVMFLLDNAAPALPGVPMKTVFIVLLSIALIAGLVYMLRGGFSKARKAIYGVGTILSFAGLISFLIPQSLTTINLAGGIAVIAGIIVALAASLPLQSRAS